MNKSYFPDRFKAARIMSGLSLQGLADRLENRISRQALHKYEKGESMPDSNMIGLLCDALDVRPDYFYRESVELGTIEFRKLEKYSVKERNRVEELTRDILSRYLELEEILGIETAFTNPIVDFEITSGADVEDAAKKIRQCWKLGDDPIFNAIEVLEDNHIKVIEIESDNSLDGFCTWVKGETVPVVVLNKNKLTSLDRKRFTTLHELGHLLMKIDHLPRAEREYYCNRFAGAMLFPEDAVRRELGGAKRSKLFLNELGIIKQQYGISIQAIAYRLKDLEIISDNYLKQFMFFIQQSGFRTEEPAKYDYRGDEESRRFRQLIFRALAEEFISMNKAASLNNQKLAEFRAESLSYA